MCWSGGNLIFLIDHCNWETLQTPLHSYRNYINFQHWIHNRSRFHQINKSNKYLERSHYWLWKNSRKKLEENTHTQTCMYALPGGTRVPRDGEDRLRRRPWRRDVNRRRRSETETATTSPPPEGTSSATPISPIFPYPNRHCYYCCCCCDLHPSSLSSDSFVVALLSLSSSPLLSVTVVWLVSETGGLEQTPLEWGLKRMVMKRLFYWAWQTLIRLFRPRPNFYLLGRAWH